jgi:NAD(P)-dependent dehydrogenase (short-subunit alcohol dehydrogenase family)
MPHLKEGSSIINTSSITAFKGNPQLVDYSATKGAQVRHICMCMLPALSGCLLRLQAVMQVSSIRS